MLPRLQVHRRELPVLGDVLQAGLETPLLLGGAHREPVLDDDDPGAHQHPLEPRTAAEELLHLFLGAEAHDPLDAGAVVPAAVEDHDLAGGGQVFDVALEVPLGALAFGGLGQRHHAAGARVEALGDALDRAALAGGVAPLEDDDHPQALLLDPGLQLHQLDLQPGQLRLVGLLVEPADRRVLRHRGRPDGVRQAGGLGGGRRRLGLLGLGLRLGLAFAVLAFVAHGGPLSTSTVTAATRQGRRCPRLDLAPAVRPRRSLARRAERPDTGGSCGASPPRRRIR